MKALGFILLLAVAPFPVQSAAVFLGLQLGLPLVLADMDSYAYWLMRVDPTTPTCVTANPTGAWRGYVVKLVYRGTAYWVFSGTQPGNIVFLCAPPTSFPQPMPVSTPAVAPVPSTWPGDDRLLPNTADRIVVYCNNGVLDVYDYTGMFIGRVAAGNLQPGQTARLRWDAVLVRNDADTLTVYQGGAWKAVPFSLCMPKERADEPEPVLVRCDDVRAADCRGNGDH